MASPESGTPGTTGPAYGFPDPRTDFANPDQSASIQALRPLVPPSLYSTRVAGGTVVEPDRRFIPRVPGFRPVARIDGTPGIGIMPGYLQFMESTLIVEAAGTRNNSQEVMPTLDGTALDDASPPRIYKAAGSYDAWLVFKEVHGSHATPRIEITTKDVGPGVIDRDERAVALAAFEVSYPGGTDAEGETPAIKVLETYVYDNFTVWSPRHQFKAYKTADDKIKIDDGWVIFPEGTFDPLVAGSGRSCTHKVAAAEFTITEAGSIWLKSTWTVSQLSSTTDGASTLTMYRLSELTTPVAEFLAVTNPPSPGDDDSTVWATGDVYWEICKLSFAGGEVFVTDQIVSGPIYVTEFTDGKLTDDS